MQSRTHKPVPIAVGTAADVQRKSTVGFSPTSVWLTHKRWQTQTAAHTHQARHTLRMRRLRYTLVVTEASSPELECSALVFS